MFDSCMFMLTRRITCLHYIIIPAGEGEVHAKTAAYGILNKESDRYNNTCICFLSGLPRDKATPSDFTRCPDQDIKQ